MTGKRCWKVGARRRRCKRLARRIYTCADDRPRARSDGLGRSARAAGDLRLRTHRRHAHRGAGGAQRGDRLVLPPAVRQRERLRRVTGSRAGRHLGGAARRAVDLHPALPPPHQHPRDHLPDGERHGDRHRLHAGGRGRPPLRSASRDPPARARGTRIGADGDDLRAPVRVRRADDPAGTAPRGTLRDRPDRSGADALQRAAVRLVGHRARPGRRHALPARARRRALAGAPVRR